MEREGKPRIESPKMRDRVARTLFLLVPALILPLFVLAQPDFNPAQRDFNVLYTGGQAVMTSPETLFDVKSHTAKTAALAARHGASLIGTTTPWLYPAVTAWLYAPLALMRFTTAFWVMTAASVVALGATAYGIAGFLNARDCRFLGLCMLATPAITGTLIHGQTAIFTLLLLTSCIYDTSENRRGVWVGLLALKPLFVLQMMGWLVLKKRWRALGIAAAISVALAAASIATTGVAGLQQHIDLLRAVGSHAFNAAEIVSQPTLSGVSMNLGLGWTGWALLSAAVVLVIAARRYRQDIDTIALLGAILIAPYMHNTEVGMAMLLVVAGILLQG